MREALLPSLLGRCWNPAKGYPVVRAISLWGVSGSCTRNPTLWSSEWDGKVLQADLFPPRIHMLKSQPPIPQNITLFGDKVFKEVI